ncbi:MAG TPA: hypothetical protein VEC96_09520 [Anaerolineae bacterium]|nr:hypothetical protein [Anaerolineae bacterium]HXV99435.1 hypothetical protein [Anaerolineae bacterium]
MLPNDIDFLIRKERCQDFMREAEQERWIGVVKHQQPNQPSSWQRAVRWVGIQLIELGLKLQGYSITQTKNLKELAENTD